MKYYLLTGAAMAAFASSNCTAFAACVADIQVQEARMTTQSPQEVKSLEAAFKYLKEAKLLCSQRSEDKAAEILNQLSLSLTKMGR